MADASSRVDAAGDSHPSMNDPSSDAPSTTAAAAADAPSQLPRRPSPVHYQHPSEPVAFLPPSPSSLSSASSASDADDGSSSTTTSSSEGSEDLREATELRRVHSILRHRSARSSVSGDGGGDDAAEASSSRPTQSRASTAKDSLSPNEMHRYRLRRQRKPKWYDWARRFWTRQISVVVPAGQRRDHLALERTFLGYLRTSLILSMTGVLVAQLFTLQHGVAPDPTLGYYVLGVPLAGTFIAAAMAVLLLGAVRFWRQQNALARGKVHAGGWEIYSIMVGSLVISVAVFILAVAIDIRHEEDDTPLTTSTILGFSDPKLVHVGT